LLVDDSNMIQKANTRALQKENFRVSVAFNGVECLQLLEEAREAGDPYAVVLLDLQMPVMGGLETITRIREKEKEEEEKEKEEEDLFALMESGCVLNHKIDSVSQRPFSSTGRTRHQFVIGVSANSDQDSIDSALATGMDDFIAKPLKVRNLRSLCVSHQMSF
jgi:CheY-like chemotaxis protein